MVQGRRWSDKEVKSWAKVYLKKGENLLTLEEKRIAPHATIWWCFNNRLWSIDWELYRKVMVRMYENKHSSKRSKKGAN